MVAHCGGRARDIDRKMRLLEGVPRRRGPKRSPSMGGASVLLGSAEQRKQPIVITCKLSGRNGHQE